MTNATPNRLSARFAELKAAGKCGFVSYTSAGDPTLQLSAEILNGLPKAGVDIIEIGVPFSDPMADGIAIQVANLRAFKAGITLRKVLDLVKDFRRTDKDTPIVLMGYFNPIYVYGIENFVRDAKESGVDGLIVADLPPEEDKELLEPAKRYGIDFIRLLAPTTDAKRLPTVLLDASGYLYYVSVTGVTGTRAAEAEPVKKAVAEIHKHTDLPVAVGFGISTPEQARAIAVNAEAVVVGSAIVNRVATNLDAEGNAKPGIVKDVLSFVATLAQAAHGEAA
ncbi:MAG: tryptophan synthase subunit alpha [Bdellovibrionales bacterium]